MVWGQAGFFSAPPLARNSRSPRARLAFASVRLKYAKNHACSAGYFDRYKVGSIKRSSCVGERMRASLNQLLN